MPPKRKDFLKGPAKLSSKKPKEPQSEVEYLDAADELEQAAGKWKAGDTAKATRFFNRAIDAYNAGIQRYPASFDLSYNKANLQYQMSQDARIVSQLGNKIDLLQETLQSHRTAIYINAENVDVLFNTAQVLTSLAEALLDSGGPSAQEASKSSAVKLLREAITIFTHCLEMQEREYVESQRQLQAAQDQDQDDSAMTTGVMDFESSDALETSSISSEPRAEWATVVEPVTVEALLETCIAQLGALTTLVGLYGATELDALEADSRNGTTTIDITIPRYMALLEAASNKVGSTPDPGPTLSLSSPLHEEPEVSVKDNAVLSGATFRAAVLETSYRNNLHNGSTYAVQLEKLFEPLIAPSPPTSNGESLDASTFNAMSAYADALMDLASAINDQSLSASPQITDMDGLEIGWTALSKAQTLLTQLANPNITSGHSAARIADVFIARGDVDLFRFKLSTLPSAKPTRAKSKMTLVANAGVFYRGARSYADRAGAADVHLTSDIKSIVAEVLKEAAERSLQTKAHWKGRRQQVERMLEVMVDEGVVDRANVEGILACTT